LPSPSGVTFPYATIARFVSVITHASSGGWNPGDDHWSRMRSASDSDVPVSARDEHSGHVLDVFGRGRPDLEAVGDHARSVRVAVAPTSPMMGP
jgi:hypothetical protein